MRSLVLVLGLCAGCVSTAGGVVTFAAAAAGPSDAPGGPLTFTNGFGYEITLTQAKLEVGSIYLDQNAQPSIHLSNSCIQNGIYVGQVLSSLNVDLLDPTPQPFPKAGDGLAMPALEGEVWLKGLVDSNQVDDPTVILAAQGTASLNGTSWPFQASITISENREEPVENPTLPGQFQICTERVINGLAVTITPSNGGTLLLRADPRAIFGAVKFDTLTQVSSSPPLYQFNDDNVSPADISLFNGLRSRGSYQLTFQ